MRKNDKPPQGKGFDQDRGVGLNEELEKAGKSQAETVDPEHTMTREPIDIRGDVRPDKRG